MDFNRLLRAGDDPTTGCGSCDIKHVFVESGAIRCIPKLLLGRVRILLVADENTYAAAGAAVEDELRGADLVKLVFPGAPLLIPDERATSVMLCNMSDRELIVGIGSGVIQDLCKFVSMKTGTPYFIVATAPSMDGYASTGAAMIMDGMKVTYPAGLPEAIIADVDVLAEAPLDMIRAGWGDIVGKYSALSDWRLAETVLGERVNTYVYDLVSDMLGRTVPLAEKLLSRDPCSVKTLTEALVAVGIAMSLAGNSRPASGSEHHLSHFFEITGIVHGEKYFPHGIDVLYSTALTAAIREKIVSRPFPRKAFSISRDEYEAEMRRVFGDNSANGCIALQDKLGTYERDLLPIYLQKEKEIKNILSECPSEIEVNSLIKAIKLDTGAFLSLYGEEKIRDAVRYAKDLKDRYTVLWLYYTLYGDESYDE